jgi:hypothetical protein
MPPALLSPRTTTPLLWIRERVVRRMFRLCVYRSVQPYYTYRPCVPSEAIA